MTPLEKINITFANSAYESFKAIRYGLRSCKITKDEEYLNELRVMQIRNIECEKELTNCSLRVEETIKLL